MLCTPRRTGNGLIRKTGASKKGNTSSLVNSGNMPRPCREMLVNANSIRFSAFIDLQARLQKANTHTRTRTHTYIFRVIFCWVVNEPKMLY